MDAMKLLGGLMGNKSLSSGLGGKLLGGLLGGGGQKQQSGGGGIAGLLGGLMGGGGGGGQQQGSGILSGLLGSVMGGGKQEQSSGGGIGGMLGGLLGGGGAKQSAPAAVAPAAPPQVSQNDQAVLMIRAMINAAKSDGRIDETEQKNIIGKLGDEVSEAEINFLKQEFAAPLNVAEFARSIPRGMEPDIYVLSLTSIDLDTQNEAKYLGELAQGMNLDPKLCNQIHEKLGAPTIFN